ncbi:F0F1 ATP synthase subunit gamma [Sulfurivermis fontis]|uniref:F0F1 ATP synthase subunit gamma n=1 Tax=Sulfurivermis fontis TaxID=1972068 RepID=UPI000FD70E70|nr:F0F1 ATP synthase subunit gamma [Sulfurivermis fontis]
MASGKEIRSKIKSVQNTQKITRAMEMVAASKMRRAQDRMAATRPYADRMRSVIQHLAHAHAEYKHPYMVEREVKRVGIIAISTDRGLCGGLNINMFKAALNTIKEWRDKNVEVDLCTIGQKAQGFFSRVGGRVLAQAAQLGDAPKLMDVIGTVKVMLDAYDKGEIDRIYLIYNRFVSTMTQQPRVEQLLPIAAEERDEALKHHWDYLYEPNAETVLDQLLMRYVESLVYQGVVENVACEMAARMVAMKAASDNAGNLISELKLAYNKARQAAITQELSEIVAGASAV